MRQFNKKFLYSGPQQHNHEAVEIFLSSVHAHDGTAAVEIIVGTNTLLTDVYDIGYNLGLNISTVLKDRFRERSIPINIRSDNSLEHFMGSVHKILRAYGVGGKQSESHKQNQNPVKRRIQ